MPTYVQPMPWVKKHTSSRKRHTVRGHYRTPPWVKTVLFFAALLLAAAIANKAGMGK